MTSKSVLIRSAAWQLASVMVFAGLWAAPRFCLFQDATMMHDDYFMAACRNVYDSFYLQEYRPLGGVYPTLCKWIFPDFYATNIPLYLNALLIGTICRFLYDACLCMKCGKWASAAAMLLFLWHPVLDDISAWNTPGFALVAVILAMGGFRAAWRGGRTAILLATFLLVCSLATYQLVFSVPMCMAIMLFCHKGTAQQEWEWKRLLSTAGAMGAAAAIYLVYVTVISPMVFGAFSTSPSAKPLAEVLADWRGLAMQTLNLYLNLFYSAFSHYIGVRRALSSWYYVPVGIAGVGILTLVLGWYRKRIRLWAGPLLLITWLALPALGILPFWPIAVYTEWRVSFVLLIPQVLALASIAAVLDAAFRDQGLEANASPKGWTHRMPATVGVAVRAGFPVLLGATACSLLPVTATDCRMRLDDYRHDRAIVDSIRAFRDSNPGTATSHRVAYVQPKRPVLSLRGDEPALMKANYVINTYSSFSYGKIWAYAMFRWYHLDSLTEEELQRIPLSEATMRTEQRRTRFADLPYVVHYPSQNVSVVVGMPQWLTWTVK